MTFILTKADIYTYSENLFCAVHLHGLFQIISPSTPSQSKIVLRNWFLLLTSNQYFVVADLKRICETENGQLEIGDHQVREILKQNGLSTQCIHARNAILCKEMTLAQLCLKINSKMGGANNSIASNNITRLVSLSY